MRLYRIFIWAGSFALATGLLAYATRFSTIPLGVPSEWTWPRLPSGAAGPNWWAGITTVAVFAAFAVAGLGALARPTRARGFAWIAALLFVAPAVHALVQSSAPPGYDVAKWVTLELEGASGYLDVAKREAVPDIKQFWQEYPGWVAGQDELHIGTHPPGLILWNAWILSAFESHPWLARRVMEFTPPVVTSALRQILPRSSVAERAVIVLTGFMTLFASALSSVVLYLLGRAWLTPAESWAAATLWVLAPGSIMFQPTADTALTLLATLALALASWSVRLTRPTLNVLAGALLAIGMQISLVFLAVGLVAGLVAVTQRATRRQRISSFLAIGLGFAFVTGVIWAWSGANPLQTWWHNQQNHARFYVTHPRSYWPWVGWNAVEFAAAVGLPATIGLVVACIRQPARIPPIVWAILATLVILTASGRSLSEVGRLWLPLAPGLLMASVLGLQGASRGATSGDRWAQLAAVFFTGLGLLILQSAIQVVYPV